jgi:hypothetical protein
VEPLLERSGAEIDEQADWELQQSQVREKLLAVNRSQLFYGLEFHDDTLFD